MKPIKKGRKQTGRGKITSAFACFGLALRGSGKNRGIFLDFFLLSTVFNTASSGGPSDSTVSPRMLGSNPRTVATSALAVIDALTTTYRLDLIQKIAWLLLELYLALS